ncbi:MAG TPA: NAD(P)-binding domain-containing protein [Steroidobacteraceae bacterium]|nr:NAD(P)-binding domain-containing protein [Steroidobacteraceae bacterium]
MPDALPATTAPTVAIVSAGGMGAQMGAALRGHGVRVITCVEGRSAATRERAARAGMQVVPRAALRDAALLLCVVPSDQAVPAARDLLDAGALRPGGPLYVDCNPLAAGTLATLTRTLAQADCDFIDACILGGPPPAQGRPALRLCASGPRAGELGVLATHGIDVQVLPGPIGTASALRVCIGGVSKGLVALFSMMITRAQDAGVGDLLRHELSRSHAGLLEWVSRQSVRLPTEVDRWSVELRQAADDLCAQEGGMVLRQMADYLAMLAGTPGAALALDAALARFFGRAPPPRDP